MKLCVGILGFGERRRYERLLSLLENDSNVGEVFLFWNGAPPDAAELAAALANLHRKLRFRLSAENLGSAGGYASLLRWFDDASALDLLWLLDDDAIPDPSCSTALLRQSGHASFDPYRDMLMAFRADLPEFPALLSPGYAAVEPYPGLCVGVHLWNLARRPQVHTMASSGPILMSSAPYGGLLIPRAALPRLGQPDTALFLYGDDTALTLRFTRSGGRIRLCPDAIVHDSEPVWNAVGGNVSNMERRILHLDDRKAYYETRNRCYLGLVFYPGNPFVYWVNRTAFLASALLLAIRHNRLQRFRLLHRALHDGERMAREHVAREARNG